MAFPDDISDFTPVAENPQVRLFLDRAVAVVRQCGGLDAKCRILLGRLADELGLSRDEAEPAIRTLLIATEDFSAGNGKDRRTGGASPPKPPPLPKSVPQVDQAPGAAVPPVVLIDDNAVLQNFIDKAAYVLAQHGGWNPKTRVILSQMAHAMGVTSREMEAALASLQVAARGVAVSAAPDETTPSFPTPPPVVGDAAPPPPDGTDPPGWAPSNVVPPPPPQPKPPEVYRSYLNKAIDDLERPRINPRRERRLIEQGVQKLGLSPVFAKQLLCEVAAERNVQVESRQAGAAEESSLQQRTEEFLRQARAIIAEQRGATLAGQIKISAAAQELGLSDDERLRAMSLLQEGAALQSQEEQLRAERLAVFRESLGSIIAALPRKIMTPDVVAQLVQRGCDYYGVLPDEAELAVRESAATLGLRYVSQQRAFEHLSRLVSEKMGGLAALRENDRQRIFAEGGHWGLGPQDIEAIILEQVETNRRIQAGRRQRAQLVIGLTSMAAVLVVIAVVGWRLTRDATSPPIATNESMRADASLDPAAPASPREGDWWDVNLAVAMTRAKVELHYLDAALEQVRSPSPTSRGNGYERLIEGLPRIVDSRTATSVLQEIVAGCHALDPSDAAATRLRERLILAIPKPSTPLPNDARPFRQAYAAAEMAIAAVARPSAPTARSTEMRQELGRALGVSLDPSWDKVELRRQVMAALTRQLYRLVTDGAGDQAPAVQPLYAFVAAEAARYLDDPTTERLDAKFLSALLSEDEDVWKQYQEPILRVVNAGDPTTVLQAVELLERTEDEGLRFYLAAGLLRRIGVTPSGQSFEEVASAVRVKFGVSARSSAPREDGWRRFTRESEEQLNSLADENATPLELFEETANLTRLAAMGVALSQGEFGSAIWEQLTSSEPVNLSFRSPEISEVARSGDAISNARSRLVSRYIDGLARSTHPVQRVGYLRGVADNAAHIQEIEPQEAELIAKYLLSPKTDEEREAIAEFLPVLGRWKLVRLALADLLPETQVRQELVEDMISQVLEGASDLGGGEHWRRRLRETLMRSVLDGGAVTLGNHPYDVAQEAMLSAYLIQAQVLGSSAAANAEIVSPTAILPAMIEARAARLSGKAVNADDREFLARLPHELAVADYLGDDDLRRLALLERIWLRLLAIDVTTARRDRADAAAKIIAELQRQDRTAKDVLVQLRNGQAALVQMWRLQAP